MSEKLPPHTLMVTYLDSLIWKRKITFQHLADLMDPVPESTVEAWLAGWSAPALEDITALAAALHVSPAEMTAAWLIDQNPDLDAGVRRAILDPLGSLFPKSEDDILRAPRPRSAMPDFSVGDPHDERTPSRSIRSGKVRKRSAAARPLRSV